MARHLKTGLPAADKAAAEFGVEITFEGPDTESQVDRQIDMLAAALAKQPTAIGFAALEHVLDLLHRHLQGAQGAARRGAVRRCRAARPLRRRSAPGPATRGSAAPAIRRVARPGARVVRAHRDTLQRLP